jgi:uncharacterized protein YbjT (DUF2867 family)
MARVLVTGVRGKTGAPLAELLVDRPDVEVLGGSSSPASVGIDGVRPTPFSWDYPSGWAAATEGIDGLFVVRLDRADAPDLISALLDETPLQTRVVLLSEQGADDVAPDGWALRVERAARDSGHRWTILRPSWFMQNFTDPRFYRDQIARTGELPFASGGARVAWIDTRDVAAVAERALLTEGHEGKVYELSGPEALSLPDTAKLLSRAIGRSVTHRETEVNLLLAGTDGFERELRTATYDRVRDGGFAVVTDTVRHVTGQSARTLKAFLEEACHELQAGG